MRALKIVALLFVCFLASLARGQNQCHPIGSNLDMCTNYNTTGNITFADNTTNAQSINVWHLMNQSGAPTTQIVSIASGKDSTGQMHHYFLTVGGSIFEYFDSWSPVTPNTWVQHTAMGTSGKKLMFGAYGGISGQTNTLWQEVQSTCPAGRYYVQYWNGSAWVQPTTSYFADCLPDWDVSQDGSGYLITITLQPGNEQRITESNDISSWGGVGNPNGIGYLDGVRVAIGGQHTAVATDSSGNIYSVDPVNRTSVALNGQTNVGPTIDDRGKILIIGTDHFVYRYNGTPGSWTKFQGTFTGVINTCNVPFCTFASESTAQVYRFPDQSMTASSNLYGNTTCKDGFGALQPCGQGITHYGKMVMQFASHSLGGQTVTGPTNTPETLINVTAQDTTYDPLDCIDNGSCFTTPSGPSVICSFAGLFYSVAIVNSFFQSEMSITRVKWDGSKTGTGCMTHGVSYMCNYNGSSWCTSTHNPPDNPVSKIAEVKAIVDNEGIPPAPTLFGWDITALCSRLNVLGFHTPWSCADATKPEDVGVDTLFYGGPAGTSPIDCTYNP